MSDEYGLGLQGFLNDTLGGGGRGAWLKNWKDKGSTTVWLHTRGHVIVPVFTHTFPIEEETKNKESGQTEIALRWQRFVSPESARDLARDMRFRDRTTDLLQAIPTKDHLLILREWLRVMVTRGAIAPDTVVFEWYDTKNDRPIKWRAGHLSGLVDRGRNEWGHSLDASWEYLCSVVDASNLSAGPQITREKQSLGEALRKCIQQEIKSCGDEEGNPQKNPYAITWEYNKNAKRPADYYSAFRNRQVEYTEEVAYQIIDVDPPDIMAHATPRDGDTEKLLAAIMAAQRIELPLDEIFGDDIDVRRRVALGQIGAPGGTRPASASSAVARPAAAPAPSVPATTGGGVRRPGGGVAPAHGGGNPAPSPGGRPAASQAAAAAAPAAPAGRRRRLADAPPPPPPPPPVEMLPCEACGKDIPADATECTYCGVRYEVEADPVAPAPAPRPAPASAPRPAPASAPRPAAPAPGPANGPARPGAARPGQAAARPAPSEVDPADQRFSAALAGPEGAAGSASTCWACGSDRVRGGVCEACGQPQGEASEDDIPF